jgi:hypothetical protein
MNEAEHPIHELADEVARDRARVEATVEKIRHRLTPRQLIDEVLRTTRDPAIEGLANLRQTLAANPVPSALIAAGVLWLLLLPRTKEEPPAES